MPVSEMDRAATTAGPTSGPTIDPLTVHADLDGAVENGYGACRNCRCPSFGGGSWRDFCNHLYCHHHRDAHR
jgi:hypothetical protein